MTITGMKNFENICKQEFIRYAENDTIKLNTEDVFIVWSCKTLQNYKCLMASSKNRGLYIEYTYNGDAKELYEDAYIKIKNTKIE